MCFLLSYFAITGGLLCLRCNLSSRPQNEQIGAIITILEDVMKITLELLGIFHKFKGYFCLVFVVFVLIVRAVIGYIVD